ncbi:MAG: ROK family glucokinase [Eubacteriales bacterium]|nr:ROK family glucokinase [Eubacteriales bacterium]
MKEYIFGVDLGGTTVKIGIFNTEGNLLHKWEIPTRREENGDYILPDIAASCKATAKEQGYDMDDFKGLGIGIPGAVDKNGISPSCVNLGWGYKEVKRELEEMIGIPCFVDNDANVAAYGEMWMGAGKGSEDMVMVTLGTGIGGGVIANGRIISGAHGYGAEIGHMRINMHEKEARCNCGKYGCFEQYCSATGIANEAKKGLKDPEVKSILRDLDEITAKDVFDAVKASDAFAIGQIEQFGRRLARGLSFIAGVTDPEIFVIGGGVSKAGNIIIDVVKRYYPEFIYGNQKLVKFVLAELGNDAGIYGCAKLVL